MAGEAIDLPSVPGAEELLKALVEEAEADGDDDETVLLEEGLVDPPRSPDKQYGKFPLTVEKADIAEREVDAEVGTYYIASARRMFAELLQTHQRWFTKVKNRKSPYFGVQQSISEFIEKDCIEGFDKKFARYVGHPSFHALENMRRKRHIHTKKV
jgi:hypothetical protein